MRSSRWQSVEEPFQAEGFLSYLPLSFMFRLNGPFGRSFPMGEELSFCSAEGSASFGIAQRRFSANDAENWTVEIHPPFAKEYQLCIGTRKVDIRFEYEPYICDTNESIPVLKNVMVGNERLTRDPRSTNFNVYVINL